MTTNVTPAVANIVIRNVEDAKNLGKQLSFRDIIKLISNFREFNPRHILPEDRAEQYLKENWEGRILDLQHFGIKPRTRRTTAKKDVNVNEEVN